MIPFASVGVMRGVLYDLTDADDVFLSIVGYAREDLESGAMSWRDMTPPEFLHLDEAGMRQAASSNGFTAPYQKEFFRKDGSRVPVLLVCGFIPGTEGHWIGYVVDLSPPRPSRATHADATAPLSPVPQELLTRLVGELVRERQRILAMLDHTPAMIWAVDRRCRLLSANAAFQAAQVAANGHVLDVGDIVLAGPGGLRERGAEGSAQGPWTSWYARVLAGESFETSADVETSSGVRHVETQFSPIRDTDGMVIGGAIVSQDVSARIAAERSLRDSETRFRRLAEALPVGVLLAGLDGEITFANQCCASIWGTDAAALLGRGHLAALEPADRDALVESWPLAARTGLERVLHVRRPDGNLRIARLRLVPLQHDGVGEVVGLVEDETERLANAQRTRQQDKMEALGTLAGGIAHDFNNMLGIILGFADRAEREPASQAEALASIRTASLRARDLVQQILAFGRRREHAMEPTDLKGLVVETMRLLRAAIPTSVLLDVVLPPQPVIVRADAAALQQVLVNLCTNARHALQGTSAAKLTVSLDVSEGLARLRVADNGPGFSSAVAERLFEPFFTTKPLGEGTGMGLAVVHGIVASHGGEITATSSDRGACFTVTLPLSADAMQRPRGSSADLERVAHVLVAEDEPLLARIVARVLTEAGHAVTSCTSAEAALAIVREAPSTIDLVLTDLSMPGMRGDELARRLAELRPDLPCLVMSGHADAEAFDRTGAPRGFLQKPFVGQELLDAVESLLRRAARSSA